MMDLVPIIIIIIIIVLLIRKANKKSAEAKARKAAASAAKKTVTKADHTAIREEPKKPNKAAEKKTASYKVSPDTGTTGKLHIKMQEDKQVNTTASGGGYMADTAIIYTYDHSFAQAQGMWVCGRCETVNPASDRTCCVCGRMKY